MKKQMTVLLVLILAFSLNATGKYLYLVQVNGKCGFIDDGGRMAIEAKYDSASNFFEDMCCVKVGDRWGYINTAGKMVIEPIFSEAHDFAEGMAVFSDHKKYGYIDRSGKTVIPAQFDMAVNFKEGMAGIMKDNRCGFINAAGKTVIEPQFDNISDFCDGMAMASLNNKYGFINKTGKFVIPAQFDGASGFSEGLAAVNRGGKTSSSNTVEGGKWGYVDKNGKIVIACIYEDVQNFSGGFAGVRNGNRWSFIDGKGKAPFNMSFNMTGEFHEGFASIQVNNKSGFVDAKGRITVIPQYDSVWMYHEGLAAVKNKNAQSWGYVDREGRYVWAMEETVKSEKTDFTSDKSGFGVKAPWRINDGALYGESGNSFVYNLYQKKVYSDCVVSGKTRWIDGANNSGFGLMFRVQDNMNCFTFQVSHDGKYGLFRMENNSWQTLVPWKMCSMILEHADNRLTVACGGGNIRCYINNIQVISFKDADAGKGYFRAGFDMSGNLKCSFGDFSIEEMTSEKSADLDRFSSFRPIALLETSGFISEKPWSMRNNELIFDGGAKDQSFAVECWDDFAPDLTVKVNARFMGGLNDWFGLVFRYRDDNNYYRFGVAQSGHFCLDKIENNKLRTLKEFSGSDLFQAEGNVLKVVCHGDRIKCYSNDMLVFDISDRFKAPANNMVNVGLFSNGMVYCSFSDLGVQEE
jgi:hypothetical protein